jgi:hypothetical protein
MEIKITISRFENLQVCYVDFETNNSIGSRWNFFFMDPYVIQSLIILGEVINLEHQIRPVTHYDASHCHQRSL